METNLPDLRRVHECAEFLQGCLEDAEGEGFTDLEEQLADLLDESIDAAARQAGFTAAEIMAAWAWIDNQEGA